MHSSNLTASAPRPSIPQPVPTLADRLNNEKQRQHLNAKLGIVPPAAAERRTLAKCADEFITMHENLPHRSDGSLSKYKFVIDSFEKFTKLSI